MKSAYVFSFNDDTVYIGCEQYIIILCVLHSLKIIPTKSQNTAIVLDPSGSWLQFTLVICTQLLEPDKVHHYSPEKFPLQYLKKNNIFIVITFVNGDIQKGKVFSWLEEILQRGEVTRKFKEFVKTIHCNVF